MERECWYNSSNQLFLSSNPNPPSFLQQLTSSGISYASVKRIAGASRKGSTRGRLSPFEQIVVIVKKDHPCVAKVISSIFRRLLLRWDAAKARQKFPNKKSFLDPI
jgi:hypothetical protein